MDRKRIAIAGIVAALASFGLENSPQVVERQPIVKAQVNVEEILRRHFVIEQVIPGKEHGNAYVIGMEHLGKSASKEGVKEHKKARSTFAPVHAEIYLGLRALTGETDFGILVGEGLKEGELILDPELKGFSPEDLTYYRKFMDRKDFAVKFFSQNPKELGYTMLELLFPESVRTFGVNDLEEHAELKTLDMELFRLAIKHVPTIQDYNNLSKRRVYHAAQRKVLAKKDVINDRRSVMHAEEAVKRAGLEDVTIVMGSCHIPLIAEELSGGKTVYVLRPKSLPEKIPKVLLEY